MRNLLWKFIALAGVMGIGLMVVLQALDGLSGDPELGARPVSASPHEHPTQPPASPSANEAKPLAPLRTQESVALPRSSQTPQADLPADPFAQGNEDSSAKEFPPADADLFPALADADASDDPPAFPEFPAATERSTPADGAEQPALPALPISAGASEAMSETDVRDVPDLNAFDPGDENSENDSASLPELTPPTIQPPVAQADPFADPVPPTKAEEGEPTEIPFDPYEPEPEPEDAADSQPAFPELPPLDEPADDSPADDDSPRPEPADSFPLIPEPESEADSNNQPEPADLGPAEAAEPGSPFSAEPEPTPVEEPPAPPQADSEDKADNSNEPPIDNLPFPAESAFDPLDAAPLETSSEPPPAETPRRSPGRASVRTPADSESPFPSSTEEAPRQAEPELPSFSDLHSPHVMGPTLNNGPECAVPPQELSGAPQNRTRPEPAPFVDPLDQLTFPDAPPALATQEPSDSVSPAGAQVEEKAEPKPQFPSDPNSLPNINPGPRVADSEEPAPASSLPKSADAPPARNAVPSAESVGAVSSAPGEQSPELKIEKTAPPKAALGQPMVYSIVVRNVGSSAAHQVIVEDEVPQGTKLTGTIPRGELADDRLIWRLGVIPPGEEKKIAVRVIPTQEGSIGSVAKVSFVAEVAARTVIAAPKLELEFTGPEKAVIGEDVTYHFKVANNGTGDVSKVFLRNLLPEGLIHPDGDDLEYEVGVLKAGESREIDLTVNAAKAGEFENKAIISAGGNLQKEATSALKIIGDRLSITRTGPKRRYVGRLATFSNTVTNQSETEVARVRVVEVVPPGMDFVEATAGGKYDPDKRTVTWAIAQLGPREEQLLKLELVARKEGKQASRVTAYDPNGTRAVVESETLIDGYTALRLDVREYDEPVDVGDQVALRVVATNRGTRSASQVIVKMQIPEELEFVSAKGPVDFKRDGATLTFKPVKSLEGRTEIEFDLVMKSIQPGDARLRLEITSEGMTKPLTREEGIRILAARP